MVLTGFALLICFLLAQDSYLAISFVLSRVGLVCVEFGTSGWVCGVWCCYKTVFFCFGCLTNFPFLGWTSDAWCGVLICLFCGCFGLGFGYFRILRLLLEVCEALFGFGGDV